MNLVFNHLSVIESKTSKSIRFWYNFFSEKKLVGKHAFQNLFSAVVFYRKKKKSLGFSSFYEKNWFWDRYLWGKTFCFELNIFFRGSKFDRKIAVEKSVFWVNFHLENVNVGFSTLSWKALFWEKKSSETTKNFWIKTLEKLQILNHFFQNRHILDQNIYACHILSQLFKFCQVSDWKFTNVSDNHVLRECFPSKNNFLLVSNR